MFVKVFGEIGKEMFEECGGKAAHLGELTSLKLRVPAGFTVVGDAYYRHLDENGLHGSVNGTAASIDFDDYADLEEKTAAIRKLITSAPVPAVIEAEIAENYARLSEGEAFVAVRSSVAIKGSSVSSFPGLMDTFHYVRGVAAVVEKVRECWASVWSARAAFARHSKGFDHDRAVIAPTIQLMVNSEVAGVLFTVNPISGSGGEVVIESNWGLGEAVVCGRCQSDLYVVTKEPIAVKEKRLAQKREVYVQAEGGGAEWVQVEPEKAAAPTLSEEQIGELCRTACRVEKHYGCHQDIEWAYEKGNLYILQARRARIGGE